MRIAFIYDAVFPWVKGGIEKRVYEISKRLVRRGHEVHWFGLKWWEGEKEIEKGGIILHGIGKRHKLYTGDRRSITEALFFGYKVLVELKQNFEVIDCQEFPYLSCFSAKLRSKFNNSKFLITWHEVWGNYWFTYLRVGGIFGWTIEKLIAKLSHTPIAVSNNVKINLEALGIPRNRIRVIPNGIDFYKIYNVKKSSEKYCDIIYVGRLMSYKNIDILIRAIAKIRKEIPNIKCCIIGEGPQLQYLKLLSKQLAVENNIKYLGSLDTDEEVYSYMKSAKIFVLPSIREGFSIVVLEANACGLPIITVEHKMNFATEIVKNGINGYVVKLSEDEIAKWITYLLRNEDIRARLARNAMNFAKNYDWDIIVNKIERLYKEVNENI